MGKIEKLTSEILLKAGWKARREERAYIYLCAKQSGSDAGVYLWINSATPKTYCSMNNVLEWLPSGDLKEGYIIYANPIVGQLDVDNFVEYFNERYKEYF